MIELAQRFEQDRPRLRAVAYRMLGSAAEADDAVQEAWIRFSRADTSAVDNLGGWLTTVTARVCLDVLRSRRSRREVPLAPDGSAPGDPPGAPDLGRDPESEALLAASVGPALVLVLEALDPPERLAYVLHDMFAVPFDEIATMVGRTPAATRQLASRARRRVQGRPVSRGADVARQRRVVEAFMDASRNGDFDGLVAVLDPDVALRADERILPPGLPVTARGAEEVAARARFSGRTPFAQPALVDGEVAIVVAPRGQLHLVLAFTIDGDRITAIDVIGDPERLAALDVRLLDPVSVV
jgi:RNA polymerase sigma-70 factor (ECF subfamily)